MKSNQSGYVGTRKPITTLLFVIFMVLYGLLLVGCPPSARLYIVRGTLPPSEKTGQNEKAFICPGQPVTLGWIVEKANSASIDQGIGNVSIPTGYKTVKPTEDTRYTLKAVGDGTASAFAEVNTISQGEKVGISAKRNEKLPDPKANLPVSYFWYTETLDQVWDPNILVTSIRLFPPTEKGWENAVSWHITKVDANGYAREFDIDPVFRSPWPSSIPILGTWTLKPNGGPFPNENIPAFVNFEVTVECKIRRQ